MENQSQCVLKRLEQIEAFDALAPEWDALLASATIENIFLTHAWLREWWRIYGATCELWTLTLRQAQTLVGVAPLVWARASDGTRYVRWMGDGEITPNHLDWLVHPDFRAEFARALGAYLWQHRAAWDILDLDNITQDSPMRDLVNEALQSYGLTVQSHVTEVCPYAALPATFEAYLQARGSKSRKHLRYSQRVLLRDFPNARYGRAETAAEVDAVFDALAHLHQARWTRRGEAGSFASEQFAVFHRAMAQQGLRLGYLRLYFIKIDQAYVAVYYCYRVGNRMIYYNAGFDERWAKYSVGILLLAHTLEQACVTGATEYDFLQGEEEYKSHWATDTHTNWCLRVASPSVRARWAWFRRYQVKQIRKSLKRLLQRG